ncbi:hypothetical protein GCM10023225_03630 [Kineococcus glutinatus]|uniref:Uncharacterized protein n=1 Tax=Kineococcus glutinatus TaxID=1070872 RepID=A0ABP9H854_9ACTN
MGSPGLCIVAAECAGRLTPGQVAAFLWRGSAAYAQRPRTIVATVVPARTSQALGAPGADHRPAAATDEDAAREDREGDQNRHLGSVGA